MENGQWLPDGQVLPDLEEVKTLYVKGTRWQLYTTVSGGYALAAADSLYEKWLQKSMVEEGLMLPDDNGHFIITVPEGELISSVEYGPFSRNILEVRAFARALRDSAGLWNVSLADGLYISKFGRILPTYCDREMGDAEWILGSWICGGMRISAADTGRMRKYAPWLLDTDRKEFLEWFGIREMSEGSSPVLQMPSRIDPAWNRETAPDLPATQTKRKERKAGLFSLPGRTALEKFFREEILDIIDHEEEYLKFGVGFPGATLLYGPPGSGKTFAVEKLADYLGWPVLQISSETVGSKYVHETSRKISGVFDTAIREAPSILIIDELESFLSSRDINRDIHLEEVGEFLRRFPDAARNHVLLFGMTNMPDSIDRALLRKGRFDHVLEVEMPSACEIKDVLNNLIKDLPAAADLDLAQTAGQLLGRPLSDVAYVVSEAGRLSVQKKKKEIDAESLKEACEKLASSPEKKRTIGFMP